jgi:hypothetical protein
MPVAVDNLNVFAMVVTPVPAVTVLELIVKAAAVPIFKAIELAAFMVAVVWYVAFPSVIVAAESDDASMSRPMLIILLLSTINPPDSSHPR